RVGLVKTPDPPLRCPRWTIVAQQDHREGAYRYEDQNGGQRFDAHQVHLAMFGRNDSRAIPARVNRSAKVGISPVAASSPSIRPSNSMFATSNLKSSRIVTVVSSMPTTSLMLTTRRAPSANLANLMTRLKAADICSRIARTGRSKPAISIMFSMRDRASRGELECTVVREPS